MPQNNKFITKEYLLTQLKAFKSDILDVEYATGDIVEYSIASTTPSDTTRFATRYQLMKKVGSSSPVEVTNSYIDIPKDYFLQNVDKITLTANDATYANDVLNDDTDGKTYTTQLDADTVNGIAEQCNVSIFAEGQVYLKFEIFIGVSPSESGNSEVTEIYLSLTDLIPEMVTYSAGYAININSSNVISSADHGTSLPSTTDYSGPTIFLNDTDNTFYKFTEGQDGESDSWEELITIVPEDTDIDFTSEFNTESGVPVTP